MLKIKPGVYPWYKKWAENPASQKSLLNQLYSKLNEALCGWSLQYQVLREKHPPLKMHLVDQFLLQHLWAVQTNKKSLNPMMQKLTTRFSMRPTILTKDQLQYKIKFFFTCYLIQCWMKWQSSLMTPHYTSGLILSGFIGGWNLSI